MDYLKHVQTLALSATRATQVFALSLPFAAKLGHVFEQDARNGKQNTATLTAIGQPTPALHMVYMLQAETKPKA
jgi:hypothetical protein